MCEFCESKKPIKIFPGPRSTHFSTSQKFIIDGLMLKIIYHMSEYVDISRYEPEKDIEVKLFDINFCPICGRDLRREKMSEQVNHPSHYSKAGRKECIVEMEEKYGLNNTANFCLFNAYKYLYIAGDKEGNSAEQDIEKARWYFEWVKNRAGEISCFNLGDLSLYLDIREMLEN